LKNLLLLLLLFIIHNNLFFHYNEKINYGYKDEFFYIIDKFEKDFNVEVNIPINFSHLNDDTLGFCNLGLKSNSILISYGYWGSLSENQKEELIYHELGHCVFKLDHDNRRFIFNMCPSSIMNFEIFDEYESKICYTLFRNYYITDLYSKILNKKY
jgi:hypothetical protein